MMNKGMDDGEEEETKKSPDIISNNAENPVPVVEETAEFLLLRPLCAAILGDPTLSNLTRFREAFALIDAPSPHLAQFVLLPFAIHFKRLHTFKDKTKTQFMSTAAVTFQKFEVSLWEMFIEIFQRLHVVICSNEDPTKVNFEAPEDQMEAAVACINGLCQKSLTCHFKTLFDDSKMHIVAHSLVVLLQICSSDVKKSIKLGALDTIHIYVSKCSKSEAQSRILFRFLPGIISTVRKIVDVRVVRTQQDIFVKGMELLQDVILATTAYEDQIALAEPDKHLSVVLSQISTSILQNEIHESRHCLLGVTDKLLAGIGQKMPSSRKVLLNNVMVLKTVINTKEETAKISTMLKENIQSTDIGFDELLEMMKSALMDQQANNNSDCLTSLAKISSYLTLVPFNYLELEEFLELLFSVICDSIVTQRRAVQECSVLDKSTLNMCYKICESLFASSKNLQDILDLCECRFTNFDGNLQSNFLGCVRFTNDIFKLQLTNLESSSRLTKLQVLQFSDHYISILDVQSTEVVLNILETEAPKTQSLLDVQKAMLLEGLGLMGKVYPEELIPVILYHIVECAGLNYPPMISESAQKTLISLSDPKSVQTFLSEHLTCVMSDLNVRILNLALHPNCPNALIFLARYFDFSQSVMVNLVELVLSRSCDPFSGGHLQYLYSKVFYAFVVSLWTHNGQQNQQLSPASENTPSSFLSHKIKEEKSLFEFINDYQCSLGLSVANEESVPQEPDDPIDETAGHKGSEEEITETAVKPPSPEVNLVIKICHRVLNFLPNSERSVRLLAMDCLIKGILVLRNEEDALLPLAHIIWQNLVPRMAEKDFVVVRKSFELLVCLCSTCGTFLKKRTMDDIFPKLSSLLTNLAMESEQVAMKNRKVYIYSQSYKLQLSVLQGLAEICQSIDIQEEELHQVVEGCILYLKPHQHKNLQAAARKVIDYLGSENSTTKYRSIWMTLIALGLRHPPNSTPPSSLFAPIPDSLSEFSTRTNTLIDN